MFDIEKALNELNGIKNAPDESLRRQTRQLVKNTSEKRKKVTAKRFAWALPSVASVLLVVFLLFSVFPQTGYCAAYYTIDINPSISIGVDKEERVLFVTSENEDAAALLNGMKLTGMTFKEALQSIISSAAQEQYLVENGHVLVAHFGDTAGISQQDVQDIVSKVSDGSVHVLVLQGTRSEYEKSKQEDKHAGIDLLMQDAQKEGLEGQDVSKIITILDENQSGQEKDKDNTTNDNADKQNKNNGNSDNQKNNQADKKSEDAQKKNNQNNAGKGSTDKETKDNNGNKESKSMNNDQKNKDQE